MTEPGNRHASNLELFLDLVFVFSVTQVTGFIAADLSVGGVGRGALLGFLVWWQWTAFTWAGTAIDLQSHARERVIVLCMVPAMLVMAVSVPEALNDQGMWFAVSYLVVQLLVLMLQGVEAWGLPHTRTSFLRYAPLAAIAPTLLLIGAFFNGDTRVWVWITVAVGMIGSALLATDARGGEWVIDPTHFAERHALFMIITLGEVLVAIGATSAAVSSERGLDAATLGAIVSASAVACVLWWAYFGFIPAVIEMKLDTTPSAERGVVARDVGSFGHFPLVFGLILYAVLAKHLIKHPEGHLTVPDRWLMVGAMVAFIGGQLAIQFRLVRALAPERLIVLVTVGALAVGASVMPGTLVVGLLAVVLGFMSVISARRFRSSELAQSIHHS